MSSETLQKVFKTLADPTRLRILRLLAEQELAVQELMEVLGMAQSRVSRHLGILREAGLLADRREGTWSLYRFEKPAPGPWQEAWALARAALDSEAQTQRDLAALAQVVAARVTRSPSFFDTVGPEWDTLRKVWNDALLRARAVTRLVPPGLRVLDLGTGTGVLARELAEAGLQVVAVDHSTAMLAAARSKLQEMGTAGVELRQGDASDLPLADAEVDAAFAHMVLQYLASPIEAVREMARVVRPGGRVVVVDFVRHDREWMRQELGVLWMGFAPEEIRAHMEATGLAEVRTSIQPPLARRADLPDTFIADARRPEEAAQ